MFLRVIFLDVLAMMRTLTGYEGGYAMQQCPSAAAEEIFEKRNRVFETNMIELSSEIKEGEGAPASRSILLIFKCFQPEIALMIFLILVEMVARCSIPFIIESLLKTP